MDGITLTDMQMDALRETGNIGAGHAATALSQLIDSVIQIGLPKLEIVDVAEVPSMLGGKESLVGAVHVMLLGDLAGSMLFVAPRDSCLALVDLLKNRTPGTTRSFGDAEETTVTHVAQILCSAYLAAISRLADLSVLPSRASFSFDMAGAILQSVSSQIGMKTEAAVLQRTRFFDANAAVDAFMLFAPDPEDLEVLLARLGVA